MKKLLLIFPLLLAGCSSFGTTPIGACHAIKPEIDKFPELKDIDNNRIPLEVIVDEAEVRKNYASCLQALDTWEKSWKELTK